MMIVTLQMMGIPKPELSVHGDIVKIDLGALLIEVDQQGFIDMISDLKNQAADHGVYFTP